MEYWISDIIYKSKRKLRQYPKKIRLDNFDNVLDDVRKEIGYTPISCVLETHEYGDDFFLMTRRYYSPDPSPPYHHG